MEQLTLDLGVQPAASLANYWAGPNQAAVAHISEWLGGGDLPVATPRRAPAPIYLWGEPGSGKTHLLESVRATLAARGAAVGWLDPTVAEPPPFGERWAALLLDDVQRYDAAQQHAAFNWFVNAQTQRRCAVLAAGALPVADLALREDLRTRLGWGHVFQLQVLGERERRAVLRRRAAERGLVLNDEALDFMLTRFSRDLASLVELLDALDRFSLRTQRAITVPLIKDMLESG